MKTIQTILLLTLIAFVYLDCDDIEKASKKACNDGLTASDKTVFSHCCYYKYSYSSQTGETCIPINKVLYDKINDYIKTLEAGGYKVESFDCKSSYLNLGIFALLFLFF